MLFLQVSDVYQFHSHLLWLVRRVMCHRTYSPFLDIDISFCNSMWHWKCCALPVKWEMTTFFLKECMHISGQWANFDPCANGCFPFFLDFNSSCVFAHFGIVWLKVSFLFENCVQIKSLIWFFEFMSPCHVAQVGILLRLCLSIKGNWSRVVIISYFVFYLHDMYHHALELQNQFHDFFPSFY